MTTKQKIHEIKTHPGPFEQLVSGLKTYEIRKFDRDYKLDDLLRLREWAPHAPSCPRCVETSRLRGDDPESCPGGDYTGRVLLRQIKHITPPGSSWLIGTDNVGILGIR